MAAYLVLASGTDSKGISTAWSTNSVMNYAGMGWKRAKPAIDRLQSEGFIRHASRHTASRPQYEFAMHQELVERRLSHSQHKLLSDIRAGKRVLRFGMRAEGLLQLGLISADSEGVCHPAEFSSDEFSEHTIWLPNSIVTGTLSGEASPVAKFRSAGCISTFRLFADLYSAQNLRDDGGISPRLLWQKFERKKIAEQGPHMIWGLKPAARWFRWDGPFASHQGSTEVET